MKLLTLTPAPNTSIYYRRANYVVTTIGGQQLAVRHPRLALAIPLRPNGPEYAAYNPPGFRYMVMFALKEPR